jgi:hypothetical protein
MSARRPAVAIVVVLLSGALFSALAALPGHESSAPRAAAASALAEVETAIGRADLVPRMEGALGSAYGGAWFDASTGKLHIGVTSASGRDAAEALARRSGLGSAVVETIVDASRSELIATQERWSDRLFGLLPPGQVTLGIRPQSNAVHVELGPAVPEAIRDQIERDAGRSKVEVSVGVSSVPPLLEREARCGKFEKEKANCDPTIVAGTRIVTGGDACTAGPAVLLKDRSKETTETFLLTAGHCIRDTGGNGKTWKALIKGGGEEKAIGASLEWSVENVDVGVIKIDNPGAWSQATQIPVIPAYAFWNKAADFEPDPVIGAHKPTVGKTSCVSGQVSGSVCGEILEEGVEAKDAEGVVTKNLIKVGPLTLAEGDSGGPWFGKEETQGLIEGTTVGNLGKNVVFQPLEVSLAALKTQYELLDETNEERKKCPMKGECWFEAGKYPITVTGTSSKGNEVLTTEAGKVECAGHLVAESEAGGNIHPTYSSCTAFGFLSATMTTGSGSARCDFALDVTSGSADAYSANTGIACSGGATIKVVASTCEMTIGSQTPSGSTSLTSNTGSSPKTITIKPNLSGIAYTVLKDGIGCPFSGTGAKTGATYAASSGTPMAATNGEDVWAAAP